MPDNDSTDINSNACGKCRAMGLKSCKCQGRSSGSGGRGGDDSEENTSSLKGSASTVKMSPGDVIAQNQHWILAEDSDLTFNFEDPDALLSITLDMELGLLKFQRHAELSKEEQEAVDELFKAIEDLALFFNQEFTEKNLQEEPIKIVRNVNTLSLKITSPKYYDLFVQQLMSRNLLPHKEAPPQQQHDESGQSLPTVSESAESMLEDSKATTPTPFDITRGPGPAGWDV